MDFVSKINKNEFNNIKKKEIQIIILQIKETNI